MLEAIIFDVDGVLVDSEPTFCKVVQQTFDPFGVELSEEEYVDRWMIKQTCSQGVIEDYGLDTTLEEIRRIKGEIANELFQGVQKIPGAEELLLYLTMHFYPLAAVSSANEPQFSIKLDAHDLKKYFQVMISGVKKHENPEPYQRAARELRTRPENTIVIEDNPSGVYSAKLAGCKVIAYPNGYTKDMDFSRADKIISSMKEIDEALLNRVYKS